MGDRLELLTLDMAWRCLHSSVPKQLDGMSLSLLFSRFFPFVLLCSVFCFFFLVARPIILFLPTNLNPVSLPDSVEGCPILHLHL